MMMATARRTSRRTLWLRPARAASRHWLIAAAALLLLPAAAQAFNFSDIAQRAQQVAGNPYKNPAPKLPKELQDLGYDQYRDIRYKPDEAYWRKDKLPFELQFFHEGLYYDRPVKISEITPKGVTEIKFDPADFDYGANKVDTSKFKDLGFAGFRVHTNLNSAKYKDEVLVFLGASYFKALGKGQRYGLSARGLAIDTGLISGEEFPRFTEFWIQKPDASAKELVIYALLDSRRAAGAYQFTLKPGAETVVEVKTRIYLRENVTKLGLAPLTSMFFFGDNQHPDKDDYRPEVHDSDGLSIASGTGEWIWRPLVNPKRLLVTSFGMSNPQGFGLMQRDRGFSRYEDLEARYDLRPSAWVEPKGNWGQGRIELLELPTPDETNDNINAYWVPDSVPPPGQPLNLEYRILWQMEKTTLPPTAWVTQTRRGRGFQRNPDGTLSFVVDFEGPALSKLGPEGKIEGVVSVDSNGELLERTTYYNEVSKGWRLALRLRRIDDSKPVEMRAYLRGKDSTLSETWSYILPPG